MFLSKIILFVLLLTTVASAEDIITTGTINSDPMNQWVLDERDNVLGTLFLWNTRTIRQPGQTPGFSVIIIYDIETDVGPITLRVTNTPEGDSCLLEQCPDIYEVVQWPDGYIPVPMSLELDENTRDKIEIMKWEGI